MSVAAKQDFLDRRRILRRRQALKAPRPPGRDRQRRRRRRISSPRPNRRRRVSDPLRALSTSGRIINLMSPSRHGPMSDLRTPGKRTPLSRLRRRGSHTPPSAPRTSIRRNRSSSLLILPMREAILSLLMNRLAPRAAALYGPARWWP